MSATLADRLAAAAHAVLEPLSVDQYYQLMHAGVIVEGAPIELIDGLLVRKDRSDGQGDIMTIGTRHSSTIRRLLSLLRPCEVRLPIVVQSQQPIHVDDRNEPEPDVSVLRGAVADYADHHPGPEETLLVIEVADSSLPFDLGRKLELYRDAGIPEYWVVNLQADVIEVFRGPVEGGWREQRQFRRGETIETELGGVPVTAPVDAVL